MDLKLNDILNLSQDELKNSKIELNMTAGSGAESFMIRWLKTDKAKRESGITDCSYWGWYGKTRNFYPNQLVFSFIKIGYDEWLLISAAKIIDIPANSRANVEILERFKALFGRLIIKYHKGNTYQRYVFKLKNVIDNCIVSQILPCMFDGEDFNGYDNVHIEYTLLKSVFDGKIMPTYYKALEKVTGIYCLTDKKTGKLYIGSATGIGGVKQRWGNYLNSQHGGNKKLIELYNKQGEKYFIDNFTFTLIEYFGMSYDTEKILERERYWKKVFNSVDCGYNDNY